MKKLLVLFIFGTLLSCEINDGNEINFELQIMSVTGVDIPAEFTLGETYEITVDYLRPNGCHEFNDFIIQPNGNTRTVAVVDTVYNDPNCSVNAEEASERSSVCIVRLSSPFSSHLVTKGRPCTV